MKKPHLITYTDGATIRLHNRRISFKEMDGKTMLRFEFADEESDKPACEHKSHRGKIRDTFLQMSNESMNALVYAYMEYKRTMKTKK